jgi:hypothetical protein
LLTKEPQTMQHRFHPIIENLKINEDGTEILLNGESVRIRVQKLPHQRIERKVVYLGHKTVNTIRLVLEAWQGPAPTGEHAARRIDESKGDHYSNLTWGKKGMTTSSVVGHAWNGRGIPMTAELYAKIKERYKTEKLTHVLEDLKISAGAFYGYERKYVKKNK